jgi:hypothetical protein
LQVSLLLGVAERPNIPAKSLNVPATPQPPSCNFIRYRTTRQLPDALTNNPGISGVRAEQSPPGPVEAGFTSFSNFDKLLTYICVDEHYILLPRYRGWH